MKATSILLLLLLVAIACQAHPGALRFLEDEGDLEGCNCSTDSPCSECQRCDCDSDAECQGDLVCYQRDAGDPIPGCDGIGTGGRTDFCAAASGGDEPDEDCFLDTITDICFSGDTMLNVWNKGAVTMEQLRVGDRLLTSPNRYETVYSFAHYHPSKEATFLQIQASGMKGNLEISEKHLLFLNGRVVRASEVAVGDQLAPDSMVTKITSVQKKGIYAPLTPSGTLLVDGEIQVSAYTALLDESDEYARFQDGTIFMSQQDAVHLFLTPYRMVCRAANAFGAASVCDSYNPDSGMPFYVEKGIQILRWVHAQNIFLQIFLLVTMCPVFGGLFGLEKMVFGGGLTFAIFLLCGMAAWKSYSVQKRV